METLEEELKRLEARLALININSPGRERLQERIAAIKLMLEVEGHE